MRRACQSVQNGIGDGVILDEGMPVGYWQLTTNDRGSIPNSVFAMERDELLETPRRHLGCIGVAATLEVELQIGLDRPCLQRPQVWKCLPRCPA